MPLSTSDCSLETSHQTQAGLPSLSKISKYVNIIHKCTKWSAEAESALQEGWSYEDLKAQLLKKMTADSSWTGVRSEAGDKRIPGFRACHTEAGGAK